MPTAILSVKYTPVGRPGTLRRSVGGFVRYIGFRDHHEDTQEARDVEGFVRYASFRDAASPEGRLFDATGTAGKAERQALTEHVQRAVASTTPQLVRDRKTGELRDVRPAIYRFVLSPADARGLDLRALTRAAMGALEERAGSRGLPPWIAAEHRNTAHPHVHIVMAAHREIAPGQYRGIRVTPERLEAMKTAVQEHIAQERGQSVAGHDDVLQLVDEARTDDHGRRHGTAHAQAAAAPAVRVVLPGGDGEAAPPPAPRGGHTPRDGRSVAAAGAPEHAADHSTGRDRSTAAVTGRQLAHRAGVPSVQGLVRQQLGVTVPRVAPPLTAAAVLGRYARAAMREMEQRRAPYARDDEQQTRHEEQEAER